MYHSLGKILIKEFDETDKPDVRIHYGMIAGFLSISVILVLFIVKLVLGLMAGSVSVVADAFHLMSHMANSSILLVSFVLMGRSATAKNPFGHGRMEHVAPLIMSVFLFVSGLRIAEESIHQVLTPHELHYWPLLPWLLLITVLIKVWLGGFVLYLGKRIKSKVLMINASHHKIDSIISMAVIIGLVAGNRFHFPQIDGIIGVLVALWLLYLGYVHGNHALVPLLGSAPSREVTEGIRELAKSVDQVEDVHEIIVHDYGSKYLISLHIEVPEKHGPAAMHEITERCEAKLRKTYGGEVVCHTDPLQERTPEIIAVETVFRGIVTELSDIEGYHEFRVVRESPVKIIILADIDVADEVPESRFGEMAKLLESIVKERIPNVAYCSFYVTPKFAY